MIKAGIIGAAGYTGGELIRLLLLHPKAQIAFAHSNTFPGKKIHEVHDDLSGDTDLIFTNKIHQDIDVLFLCVGGGESETFLKNNFIDDNIRVIDLSHDFRLTDKNMLGEREFTYGLVELNEEKIKAARNIANPGCFATAIQLALLPLAKDHLLKDDIHVSAITGSTGAGKSLQETTHFSWRANNVNIYKPFTHQHLGEISQSIYQLQSSFDSSIHFIPYRGNFTRGIFASVYTKSQLALDEIEQAYDAFYSHFPLTHLHETSIHLKQVINTNKCLLHLEKHGEQLLITSAIDNLLKGASGQAIQNMNLMFEWPVNTGLSLKAAYF